MTTPHPQPEAGEPMVPLHAVPFPWLPPEFHQDVRDCAVPWPVVVAPADDTLRNALEQISTDTESAPNGDWMRRCKHAGDLARAALAAAPANPHPHTIEVLHEIAARVPEQPEPTIFSGVVAWVNRTQQTRDELVDEAAYHVAAILALDSAALRAARPTPNQENQT